MEKLLVSELRDFFLQQKIMSKFIISTPLFDTRLLIELRFIERFPVFLLFSICSINSLTHINIILSQYGRDIRTLLCLRLVS